MKKSSFLLLIGIFLFIVGVIYFVEYKSFSTRYPPVRENTKGYLNYPNVGDLYVISKNDKWATFFKIVGNPGQEQFYILKGYEQIPTVQSPEALFNLMSYYHNYDPEMKTISEKEITRLRNNLKIYRQAQHPDVTSVGLYYNTPLGFFGTFLLILCLVWLIKSILLINNTPAKLLDNPNNIYLSTGITTFLFLVFFIGHKSHLHSWEIILTFYVLSIIPITYIFHYVNRKFFIHLDFFDREINKFFCLFIIGFLIQTCVYTAMIQLFQALDLIFSFNFYKFELIGLPTASITALIGWFLIATLNFLNNFNQRFFNFQKKADELDQAKLNELKSQAELDALQAKVNPHFLYNSLNSIAGLAQEDPGKTEEMAIALSHFYKYSTNRQTENWSNLEQEIEILETYLDIEKIRFGKRLQYKISCPDTLKHTKVPRFLLQPLVENAIKYGYQSDTNSIDIQVVINKDAHGEIVMQVFDGGHPFPQNLPSGYGVQSVRKKLDLLLPDAHELAFVNEPQKHVAITLY